MFGAGFPGVSLKPARLQPPGAAAPGALTIPAASRIPACSNSINSYRSAILTLTNHYVKFVSMEKEELIITAAQAQLQLSTEEEGRLSAAVTEMLDYFSKMSEVDVDNLAPTTHALVRDNALRVDNPNNNSNPNIQGALIAAAPDSADNFIVIPNVL